MRTGCLNGWLRFPTASNKCFGTVQTRRQVHQYKSRIFMKIHPDLFATETEKVKSANLKCIQILNELLQSFTKLVSLVKEGTSTSLHIPTNQRLLSSYDLTCYVRVQPQQEVQTEAENGVPALKEEGKCELQTINHLLIVPPQLRKNSSANTNNNNNNNNNEVTRQGAAVAITNLEVLILQFVQRLGIALDAKDVEECNQFTKKVEKTTNSGTDREASSGTDDFNHRLLERRCLERVLDYQFARPSHFLFSGPPSKWKDELIDKEINEFIQQKHIYTRNLSKEEQIVAIERFQTFVRQYGSFVNFSNGSWHNIMFVLYAEEVAMHDVLEKMSAEGRKPLHPPRPKSKLPTLPNPSYRCTKREGYIVVEVPHKFRPTILVNFLIDNVENTIDLFG